MKMLFKDIPCTGMVWNIVDDGWFPYEDVDVAEPVSGCVTARRRDDSEVLLTGVLQTAVVARCDRCGKKMRLKVDQDFSYTCVAGEESFAPHEEIELREEEYDRIYCKDSVIDIGAILREQVFLAMPVGIVCRSDCKGLCFVCGIDLNEGRCTCERGSASSPFSVLGKVKGR
ncbi:MAG: hypothetical protein CR981_04145 [Proteobacteria bacterium]|nr:MAG: hypothetical protein CR981_04145 [Pseudomonadota bacterium]